MKEKGTIIGKVFLINIVSAVLCSIIFLTCHERFGIPSFVIFFAMGVMVATFYLNFVKDDERSSMSHIMLDVFLVVGTFVSRFVNYMFYEARKWPAQVDPTNGASDFQKTIYAFFKEPFFNKVNFNDMTVESRGETFSIWFEYVLMLIFAFVGLYLVFVGLKIGETWRKKTTNKDKDKRK